ncbi:cell division protein DivIVA [Sinomonas cellulolyticus]|jgi:DivIVA domain-containing protein|uniref:Cell wall synthesis protein Wag31 n=1 Tax=Sinomonas cellulolyticus TaxID=2801916 RepID=A0ABS1K207_9MICC|nr:MULTISPECIES: DivIVA domain-containing protein [Sinomonas]MBL0705493.1 DivIVA domain-containing protein [Sinomonas cellulolyticus]GHG41457.1 cell division protein DivIVA [Sinomonas sp. KCTC 49339]
MALTPEDVVNKRFQPTKFREGYDQDEVDDFLDEIVIELRRLNQENDELRKKVAELSGRQGAPQAAEKQGSEVREAAKPEPAKAEAAPTQAAPAAQTAAAPAQQTAAGRSSVADSAAGLLAMAQQMHDKHVQDGLDQRDKIIAEAQIEASSLVNDAQEKSRKTLGALEQQRSVLERKVEQLRGFERDYRSRLKNYIEGQLRDLEARGSVATAEISDNAEV